VLGSGFAVSLAGFLVGSGIESGCTPDSDGGTETETVGGTKSGGAADTDCDAEDRLEIESSGAADTDCDAEGSVGWSSEGLEV
jgi:hypothetical protein